MRKIITYLVVSMLLLTLASPASAQSAGPVILTGLAEKTVTPGLITYRFADGGLAYFATDLGWDAGRVEFRDEAVVLYADPARGGAGQHLRRPDPEGCDLCR